MVKRIPATIVTGFLGVGKTSAILHWLSSKPTNEKWAVIVNEYGEVSIDGPIIASIGDGIKVKDISGGCMCCIGKAMFDAALADIAVRMKPDRILIEPSGLGHIGDLLRTMKSKTFTPYIDVKAPICLVDPRQLNNEQILQSPVFESQIEISKIIIANKSDLTTGNEMENFYRWAKELNPPKALIQNTTNGKLSIEWLDFDYNDTPINTFNIAGLFIKNELLSHNNNNEQPQISKPIIITNSDKFYSGLGIRFHAEEIFHHTQLIEFLNSLSCIRLKGIMRTNEDWMIIQKTGEELSIEKTSAYTENRIEFIFLNDQEFNFDKIIEMISSKLISRRSSI